MRHMLEALAKQIRSLSESETVVLKAVSLREAAIPLLREVLFERDPTGIYHARIRAIKALAALGAFDPIAEYVREWRPATDPVERLGDEAVLSTAARALAAARRETDRSLLLEAARTHPVPGVLEAVGEFGITEAIPHLIKALEDDVNRASAEQALKKIGRPCVSALVEAALSPHTSKSGRETPSSVIRRRSALRLLSELGIKAESWRLLCRLTNDPDDEVAALACRLGLCFAPPESRQECALKLVRLLEVAGSLLKCEIEEWLVDYFAIAGQAVERALQERAKISRSNLPGQKFFQALLRIKARATRP